jgi:repressor LexA
MKKDHKLEKKSIPQNLLPYTEKQGQYLAFIYYYTKVNCYPPAERDMERFFRVSPPSVHRMLIDLEKKKLISRIPRQPRSITVLLRCDQLPLLL